MPVSPTRLEKTSRSKAFLVGQVSLLLSVCINGSQGQISRFVLDVGYLLALLESDIIATIVGMYSAVHAAVKRLQKQLWLQPPRKPTVFVIHATLN